MQPGCLALFGTLAALGSEWHPRVLRLEVNGATNGLFTPVPAAHWGIAEDVGTAVLGLLNMHFSDCAYGCHQIPPLAGGNGDCAFEGGSVSLVLPPSTS